MSEANYIAVTTTGEFGERAFATFEVNGVGMVICRHRDEYYALENRCSHARATFDDGRLRGLQLYCPLHGGSFDIRDGSPRSSPARKPIRVFPLRVVEGRIEVALESG